MSNKRQQLACLYTKHKTQKRKVWQDGRLVLDAKSSRAILHDANPPPGSGDPSLGECEITCSQLQAILRQYDSQNADASIGIGTTGMLETERYLIEIEGPWADNNNSSFSAPTAVHGPNRPLNGKKPVSSSMKKLLSSKFQKPKSYVPPPPGTQTSRMETVLGKRRRPLQPGELVARHYGGGPNSFGSNRGGFSDAQVYVQSQNYQRQREDPHQRQGHGNTSDNNSRGAPRFRPQMQHHGGEDPSLTTEKPINNLNLSSQTLGDGNSAAPVGRVGGPIRSRGPADSGSQVGSAPQFQRYRRTGPQRKSNAIDFVQNEFDSARYYGTDEEEEEDNEESLLPLAPSFAQGLVGSRKGENQQKDKSSPIEPSGGSRRNNGRNNEKSIGDSLQRKGYNVEQQEMQAQRPQNQDHANHHSQCLSSSGSSTPLINPYKEENHMKIRDGNITNECSVSRNPNKQHISSDKTESHITDRHHHRKNEPDNDESESEESDEEFSNDDVGAPVPFRLKFSEPLCAASKSKEATTVSSIPGNRLLALFGAGVDGPNPRDSNRRKIDNEKENSMPSRSNDGEDNSKIFGRFGQKIDRSHDDTDKDRTTSDKEGKGKQQENLSHSVGGFYLPPAATSSEESSDGENSDEE